MTIQHRRLRQLEMLGHFNGGSTQKVTQIDTIINSNNIQGLHGICAESLGTDANDVSIILIQETFGIAQTVQKSWFMDFALKSLCLDINIDLLTIQFMLHRQDSAVYFGQITISSIATSINLLQIRLSTSASETFKAYKAQIVSSTELYIAGYMTQLNSQTYSQNVGFIHKYGDIYWLDKYEYLATPKSMSSFRASRYDLGTNDSLISLHCQ
eukprot:403349874